MDPPTSALFRSADVVVGLDSEELLLALHSDSSHVALRQCPAVCRNPVDLACTCSLATPAAHVVAMVPDTTPSVDTSVVDPGLARPNSGGGGRGRGGGGDHGGEARRDSGSGSAGVDDGRSGVDLPPRLRFLASAGLEVWPVLTDAGTAGTQVREVSAPVGLLNVVRRAVHARSIALEAYTKALGEITRQEDLKATIGAEEGDGTHDGWRRRRGPGVRQGATGSAPKGDWTATNDDP